MDAASSQQIMAAIHQGRVLERCGIAGFQSGIGALPVDMTAAYGL